jgi:hypothetical protein
MNDVLRNRTIHQATLPHDMRRRAEALVGVAVTASLAFLFLAPVIPSSKTIYTGLDSPQIPASPKCSNPLNLSGDAAVNPALNYKGFESVSYLISGVGIVFYSECTIL